MVFSPCLDKHLGLLILKCSKVRYLFIKRVYKTHFLTDVRLHVKICVCARARARACAGVRGRARACACILIIHLCIKSK